MITIYYYSTTSVCYGDHKSDVT